MPEVADRIIEAIDEECDDLTSAERAMVLLFVNKMTDMAVHLDVLAMFERQNTKEQVRNRRPYKQKPSEPDGWYECPKCGCVVGYDELYGGGLAIVMDDYQIPFDYCPKCGRRVDE